MNQKSIVIALAMLALVATVALATPQAFAQVSNGGITEED